MRNNLEIGGENTSKADALLFLLDKLGLTRKNLLACGDSPNDLEMLQLAEIGVVMGNADEALGISPYLPQNGQEDPQKERQD